MTSTARKRPEWIGKTPDKAAPSWVKDRILSARDDRCANCRNDFCAQLLPEFDHITALVNLGENRESNLQALCGPCHGKKTAADVALKAKVARVRGKHLGIKPKSSRPVGGRWAKDFIQTLDGTVLHRATREPVTRRWGADMSDFPQKDVGQGAGAPPGADAWAGLCGAAAIPGHHPPALAAVAPSPGGQSVVGSGAGEGSTHTPECDLISRAAIDAALDALKVSMAEKAMADGDDPGAAVALGMAAAGVDAARAALRSLPATQAQGEEGARVGWNAAIAWVEKHLADYVAECGTYDPSTGVTEFPDGGEWESSVQDIIDGMRLAMPSAAPAPVSVDIAGRGLFGDSLHLTAEGAAHYASSLVSALDIPDTGDPIADTPAPVSAGGDLGALAEAATRSSRAMAEELGSWFGVNSLIELWEKNQDDIQAWGKAVSEAHKGEIARLTAALEKSQAHQLKICRENERLLNCNAALRTPPPASADREGGEG